MVSSGGLHSTSTQIGSEAANEFEPTSYGFVDYAKGFLGIFWDAAVVHMRAYAPASTT